MMRTMRARTSPAVTWDPHRAATWRKRSLRIVQLGAVLLAASVAPTIAADAGVAPVYKCQQAGGTVLYADYPCKGGAVVDIRPGAAAPNASEQLARARDELDRAAARRQAIEAAEALRRREIEGQREFAGTQTAAYAPDDYLPAYGYYMPYANPRVHLPIARPRDRPRAEERRVPAVIRRP